MHGTPKGGRTSLQHVTTLTYTQSNKAKEEARYRNTRDLYSIVRGEGNMIPMCMTSSCKAPVSISKKLFRSALSDS